MYIVLYLVIRRQTQHRAIEPDSQLYIEHSFINIKCVSIIKFYRFCNVTYQMIFFCTCLNYIFESIIYEETFNYNNKAKI